MHGRDADRHLVAYEESSLVLFEHSNVGTIWEQYCPGGASKFLQQFATFRLSPSVPQPRLSLFCPWFSRCSFRGLASGEAREPAELFGRGPQTSIGDDGVALEDRRRLVSGELHRHTFKDTTPPMLRVAVRRKSGGMRPGQPAARHAFSRTESEITAIVEQMKYEHLMRQRR
jgi:hypothetical protein